MTQKPEASDKAPRQEKKASSLVKSLDNVEVPKKYDEVFVNDLDDNEYNELALNSTSFIKHSDLVQGKVINLHGDTLVLDINYKNHATVDLKELADTALANQKFELGDMVEVYLSSLDEKDKYIKASIIEARNRRRWGELHAAQDQGKTIHSTVVSSVRGGLILDIGIKAFLPASLIELYKVENFDDYIGRELECKIIELDRAFSNVILSRKAVLLEKNKENRELLKKQFKVGQIRVGVVTSLVNFGAFVEFGGIDGLVHISEISWNHIRHPSDILRIGQKIEVEILSINEDFTKISLSHKSTCKDPWREFANKYDIGMLIRAAVSNIFNFGFFVKLDNNIEGLVHISEILPTKIDNTYDVVDFNNSYILKILDIDLNNRRIALSLRATLDTFGGMGSNEEPEFRPELYSRYFKKSEDSQTYLNEKLSQENGEVTILTGDSEEKETFEMELAYAKELFAQHVKQIEELTVIFKEIKEKKQREKREKEKKQG
jgi:small subunit ribosomal protein S1